MPNRNEFFTVPIRPKTWRDLKSGAVFKNQWGTFIIAQRQDEVLFAVNLETGNVAPDPTSPIDVLEKGGKLTLAVV